jgi:excinuclease ABC subunit B
VTTLTKRMSEDLTDYLKDLNVRVKYLHSEIASLERVELLRDLRLGGFDVLVGINLLREGLDLPEVSLVAILDADKEGFLRSKVSMLQTIGRAARNSEGRVIMYADRITDSMRYAIEETNRRRDKQIIYNIENDVTPRTVTKTKAEINESTSIADILAKNKIKNIINEDDFYLPDDLYTAKNPLDQVSILEKEMRKASDELAFEKAAKLRDEIAKIKSQFNL